MPRIVFCGPPLDVLQLIHVYSRAEDPTSGRSAPGEVSPAQSRGQDHLPPHAGHAAFGSGRLKMGDKKKTNQQPEFLT